ncbi:hypothetical protein GOP47_0017662 [Adiantum capillus-veneris]|uniref:Uncharacterized protein n=1 Tax=Adiantum capillus-veneris TaxID=13818 RepID=A0A9D4Z9W7_ADICA|nr:hypothetical protein GOP47_0017662 [Adiantum capillus-veneris]
MRSSKGRIFFEILLCMGQSDKARCLLALGWKIICASLITLKDEEFSMVVSCFLKLSICNYGISVIFRGCDTWLTLTS